MKIKKYIPTIMSIAAAGGVVITAVTAIKQTPKAIDILNELRAVDTKVTKFDYLKALAPVYLPTIIAGTATIGLIFGSNELNKRTIKKLGTIAAASMATKTDGLRKILNEKKPKEDEFIFIEDTFLIPFVSNMTEVHDAEDRIREIFSDRGYANLIDVYREFGMLENIDDEDVKTLEEWGWSVFSEDDRGFIDINFIHEIIEGKDGTNYILIGYENPPILNYFKALWG